MDYACPTDRLFISKKPVKTKTVLSEETKARKAFLAEYRVSAVWNPDTKEYEVRTVRREHVQNI